MAVASVATTCSLCEQDCTTASCEGALGVGVLEDVRREV